jgi:hypothetical protein
MMKKKVGKEEESLLDVGRVTRVGNLVVNIEVVTEDWIDTHQDDPYFYFPVSPGKNGKPAWINYHYDPETGNFEQPYSPDPLLEDSEIDAS